MVTLTQALMLLRAVLSQHLASVPGVPKFSWDKIPTYIHCQNKSGPLSADVAARFAERAAFVTIEKEHAQAVEYGGAPPQFGNGWRSRHLAKIKVGLGAYARAETSGSVLSA